MKKLKYYFDNIVSKGTGALMALLLLASVIFVLILAVIAVIYARLNPDILENYAGAESVEGLDSLTATFWFVFHHVLAPGEALELIIQSPFLIFVIMTLATLWGIIVFSLIVSFISSAFNDKLEALRQGRNQVVEKNHTLILDYNESVPILIAEFIEAQENFRKKIVVILSEKDPVEVLRDIHAQTPKSKSIKIIIRMGNPARKEDLEMVSAATAKSIIITTQNDIAVIKQILALKKTNMFALHDSSYIVAMVEDAHNLEVIEKIGEGRIETIYLEELKSKVFARSCLHPGLSHVYKEIFSFAGNELYLDIKENFVGKPLKELYTKMEGGYVLGVLKNQVSYINPDLSMPVKAEDKLIILAESHGTYEFIDKAQKSFADSMNNEPYINSSRRVLGIGFNANVPGVILDMEKYVGANSKLTLIVPNQNAKNALETALKNASNFDYEILIGNTHSHEVLSQFHYENYDTLAVFANDDNVMDTPDEETLLTLLHLQEFKKSSEKFPTIVVELKENKSVDTLEYVDVDDFIVSNILISKLMAQVSENRYLYTVIKELVSDYGQEFYLRRAAAYIQTDQKYPMYALVEAALLKNEIFIGYKKKGGPIILNPSKYAEVQIEKNDRIIVAAKN